MEKRNVNTFVFWGIICLLANILCTFADGYDGDQSFWVGWTQQLVDGGFGNFKGNYPPVYVFWLWIVAHIHDLFGIGIGKTFFMKFMCLWPVYFSHVFLLDWLCRFMDRFHYPEWKRHALAGFVALNPALLLAGPVWGQVDLFPVMLAVVSIYCMARRRTAFFAPMLYVLSLLAKFQMILFLPVFGGLFLKHWRYSWRGLVLIIPAVALVLLPYALGGNMLDMLSRAYIKTVGQYPYATYNAANLWYIWAGNTASDAVPVWGLAEHGLGFLFKPSIMGKVLFVLVSVFTLVKTLFSRNIRTIWGLAFLNALAFFTVLPGMHERYLLYAIPVGLCWLVWDTRRAGLWSVLATFVSAVNVMLIVSFKGHSVWNFVSALSCVVLVLAVISFAFPNLWRWGYAKIARVKFPRFVPYAVLSVVLLAMLVSLLVQMQPVSVSRTDEKQMLTEMSMKVVHQDYKKPKMNLTVDGSPLQVRNRVYRDGIGTHAASLLRFRLPENAESFHFGVAIDDETYGNGDCEFFVKLDGSVVWQSVRMTGKDAPIFDSVAVDGHSILELVTEDLGSNSSDHADWLLPYIKLR